ncbi:MAG: AzlC family ABC transporter permease [Anaerolineae bacterium]|nr:AzlC family ABC transporter permease [Anaerolineae bacterium]
MHPTTPTRREEFWAGARATLPLIAGAIPFGIIFGAVAVTSSLSVPAVMSMSLFVFAGSAQFIAVGLVAGGLSLGVIVLTTFFVNLRHALYAASLAPYMKDLPQRWLLPLGFWLTDESYAVVILRYNQPDASPYKHWFFLGSAIAMYTNWQICTLIGIIAGRQIADPQSWGLDFAMIVTFIGIVVSLIQNKAVLVSVIVSGATAVFANHLPNKLGLMLAALLGILAGVAVESIWPQPGAETETPGAVTGETL